MFWTSTAGAWLNNEWLHVSWASIPYFVLVCTDICYSWYAHTQTEIDGGKANDLTVEHRFVISVIEYPQTASSLFTGTSVETIQKQSIYTWL